MDIACPATKCGSAFKLKHNFDDKGTPKRGTPNLMDYLPAGNQATDITKTATLRKYQWDEIISPRLIAFGWSEEWYAEDRDPLSKYLSLILKRAKKIYKNSKVNVVIYSKLCETKVQNTTYRIGENPTLVVVQPYENMLVKTLIVFYDIDQNNNTSYGYNLSSVDTLNLLNDLSDFLKNGTGEFKYTSGKFALRTLSGEPISCDAFINKMKQQNFCAEIDDNFINALYDDADACIKENFPKAKIIDKREISSTKQLSELETRLFLIKQMGIDATIYLSDKTTVQSDIVEIQEELKKGEKDEIKLWYEVDNEGNTFLKDFHIGTESVVLSNGINQREIVKELFEFMQKPDFLGSVEASVALLECLADWINQLKIPEKYWNPNSKDDIGVEYNPVLFNIFRTTNSIYDIQSLISFVNEDVKKSVQGEFALACGIYDGAVGTISALPDGGALILKFVINKDNIWEALAEQLQKMQVDCALEHPEVYYLGVLPGYGELGYGKCIWDAIYKHFTSGSEYQVYHKSGKAIFDIVLLVAGFSEAGIAVKLAKTADYLDAFNLAIKVISPVSKGIFRCGKSFIRIAVKDSRYIARFVDKSGHDLQKTLKWCKVTDNAGNTHFVGINAQ